MAYTIISQPFLRWSPVTGRGSLVEKKLSGHFSTNL
jgi:hypothetical protein